MECYNVKKNCKDELKRQNLMHGDICYTNDPPCKIHISNILYNCGTCFQLDSNLNCIERCKTKSY